MMKNKDTLPMRGLRNPMKQKDITGKINLYETPPKEILDAAGYYFTKQEEFNNSKSNVEKAKEELLRAMRKWNMTQAIVSDSGIKKRIVVQHGEEKIKIVKTND